MLPIVVWSLWAPVAELVDAADSKSVESNLVLVRVRPGAPILSYCIVEIYIALTFIPHSVSLKCNAPVIKETKYKTI